MTRAAIGTLRKLKSGRYQARFTFPDGVRRAADTTFLTKGDARAWLSQMAADVSRGQWQLGKATVPVSFRDSRQATASQHRLWMAVHEFTP
jgi:hypothetical protein